jgi:tetratricopeptide (TPR) repeat protein
VPRVVRYLAGQATCIAIFATTAYPQGSAGPIKVTDLDKGMAAFRSGDCHATLSALDPVLRDKNAPAAAVHAAAVCSARTGDHKRANPLFRRLVKLEPRAWQAWNNLGVNEAELGALSEAIIAFRKASELAPSESGPALNLAKILQKKGDLRAAFQVLEGAQRRRPQEAELTTLWLQVAAAIAESAAASIDNKNYARALDDLLLVRRPLEVGPSWHNLIGYAQFRLNRPQPALEHLQKALALEPQNEDYVFDLAEFLSHHRSYDQLLKLMKVGAARHPNSPRMQLGLALAHILENGRADAVPILEALLAANPAFEPAYPVLGEAYQDLGRHEESLRLGRQLQRLNPANPKGWYIEGSALLELARRGHADMVKAAESLKRALEIDPSFVRPRFLLARALVDQRQYAAAEEHLQTILQLDPQHGQSHYVLGQLYQKTGRLERARVHLDKHRNMKEEERSGDYRRLLIESVASPKTVDAN